MKFANYLKPMLAKIRDKPFDDADWIFEIKYDGYRAIAEVNKGKVKLYSRNGLDFSADYPAVYAELKKLKFRAVFDGEIVALDSKHRPNFQLFQLASKDLSIPVVYYVFDLLFLDGKNLQSLTLLERKEKLEKILPSGDQLRYSQHIVKDGKRFFNMIRKKDMEGIMAKDSHSLYHPGKRTGEWLKIKNHNEQEAIIAGFTEPRGSRKYFGSIILAVHDRQKLIYAGHAGTGFNDSILRELYQKMSKLVTKKNPFGEKIPENAPVTWIKPSLVCNIKFTEWTRSGQMRHPVFLGLRKDKKASEVIKE